MNKSRFSYLKLAVVAAALAMALVPSMRTSTAKNQPSPVANAALDADLANEERVLANYVEDLAAYDKLAAELGKRARFVSGDLDPVQRQSDDLKGRLSAVQSAVAEIVKKLKASNEWNDLDKSIAASITDANRRSFFQESSLKQLLDESSTGLTSHANEISRPLDNLRKRLTSRYGNEADFKIVRAGYEAPAPVFFYSVRCTIGGIRLGLNRNKHASDALLDTVSCNCGHTYGLGTLTPCDAR